VPDQQLYAFQLMVFSLQHYPHEVCKGGQPKTPEELFYARPEIVCLPLCALFAAKPAHPTRRSRRACLFTMPPDL
jgi:hypothetical protein